MAHRRQLMSLPTAAEQLGVSVKTLRRRIADGSLPAYRIGTNNRRATIRVDLDDAERLLRRIPTAVQDGSDAA